MIVCNSILSIVIHPAVISTFAHTNAFATASSETSYAGSAASNGTCGVNV